jgi:hypothetical protein
VRCAVGDGWPVVADWTIHYKELLRGTRTTSSLTRLGVQSVWKPEWSTPRFPTWSRTPGVPLPEARMRGAMWLGRCSESGGRSLDLTSAHRHHHAVLILQMYRIDSPARARCAAAARADGATPAAVAPPALVAEMIAADRDRAVWHAVEGRIWVGELSVAQAMRTTRRWPDFGGLAGPRSRRPGVTAAGGGGAEGGGGAWADVASFWAAVRSTFGDDFDRVGADFVLMSLSGCVLAQRVGGELWRARIKLRTPLCPGVPTCVPRLLRECPVELHAFIDPMSRNHVSNTPHIMMATDEDWLHLDLRPWR